MFLSGPIGLLHALTGSGGDERVGGSLVSSLTGCGVGRGVSSRARQWGVGIGGGRAEDYYNPFSCIFCIHGMGVGETHYTFYGIRNTEYGITRGLERDLARGHRSSYDTYECFKGQAQ